MARLFGLIGNRADLCGRVLTLEAAVLRVRARDVPESSAPVGPFGWGLGFYQGGEVLLRRRPLDEHASIDIAAMAGDVRADVLIGHVRNPTVGSLRTENTHPFRYRQWLFAKTGTIDHFGAIRERLISSVPDFIKGELRGDTDSEALFHLFLTFLHDAGHLQDVTTDAAAVREALRATFTAVDGMVAEVGGTPGQFNVMLTGGDALIAAHRGSPMYIRTLQGREDAETILGGDGTDWKRQTGLSQLRFVILASDFEDAPPQQWKPIAERTLVTVARGEEPIIEPI